MPKGAGRGLECTQAGTCETVQTETGTCEQAVSIALSAGGAPRPGPHSPIQWHTQPSVHALRHPPYLLILQFPRYSYGPERASKNHANIIWPRILNMPLFTAEGLESCNITYKVEAAILHRGQCITEGHYTTLLHDEGETLLCDDGVAPRPVPLHSPLRAGLCYQSREVYLLICRRGEAPRC